MIDPNELFIAFFLGLLSFFAHRVQKSFDKLTNSVESLNEKMAVVVTKLEQHDKEIAELKAKREC